MQLTSAKTMLPLSSDVFFNTCFIDVFTLMKIGAYQNSFGIVVMISGFATKIAGMVINSLGNYNTLFYLS